MKKSGWVKSVVALVTVIAVLGGAGFFLLTDGQETPLAANRLEAEIYAQSENLASEQAEENGEVKSGSPAHAEEENEEDAGHGQEQTAKQDAMEKSNENSEPAAGSQSTENGNVQTVSTPAPVLPEVASNAGNSNQASGEGDTATAANLVPQPEPKPAANPEPNPASKTESQPAVTEIPAPVAENAPEAVIETVVEVVEEKQELAPVSYSFGSARNFTFRMEVRVTNNGSETSRNVRVSVPLLENSSPYQTTELKSANYSIVSTSGRVSTFDLGDIAPGESKTIVADFSVTMRPVSINSTNDTVEKARSAFEQHRGSGNCRTLALAFINQCRSMGITAREVVGFARPVRAEMTSGSLQGCRHSWAEFYVDGLGWVPVDLTFQYFGELPHASHVVESYSDQSIKINFSGGSLSAGWSNNIL